MENLFSSEINIQIIGLCLALIFALFGAGWAVFTYINPAASPGNSFRVNGHVEGDIIQVGVDNSTHIVNNFTLDEKTVSHLSELIHPLSVFR